MADYPPPKIYRLNEERLAEQFREKMIQHDCPFCHTREWALLGANGTPALTVPWGTGMQEGIYASGIPVIAFRCNNCGFLRQHAVSAFDNVLEDVTHGG